MSFAEAADVGVRLGRDLTESETATAESVIATVTALIVAEVHKDDEWAEALDPVPGVFKALCVEKAVEVLTIPPGIAQESLGEHSVTFAQREASGIFLTPDELRAVRRALSDGTFRSVTLTTPYSGTDEALPELPLP